MPTREVLHGVTVSDDYRWLEDSAAPAVRAWNDAQNRYTRTALDRFPGAAALRERVRELLSDRAPRYFDLRHRRGALFARKAQPPREQPVLVWLRGPDDPASEVVLVDPVQIDPRGTTTIDFYVPSPDGSRVAVSLSEGGTEDGTVHIYDVATHRQLPDVIPRVHGGTAGGDLAWSADGNGFYYTRYPREGERPTKDLAFFQQVYYHQLGTPTAADRYELGKDLPRIAETTLVVSDDGKHVLARVANGDGGEHALYLRGPAGAWQQVSRFEDGVVDGDFGPAGQLLLLSRKGAPRGQVLALPLVAPQGLQLGRARVVVPEGPTVLQAIQTTQGRVYTLELSGGTSQIRAFEISATEVRPQKPVPVRPVSTVRRLVRLSGDELLFDSQSFTEPLSWLRYAPGRELRRTALSLPPRVDFSDVEVRRLSCISSDKAAVPLTVMLRKGLKLDGKNPTILTGYGGFGISLTPDFKPPRRLWLDQGGVYAVANLRGGGEFGEEWHQQGMLTRKQQVFDDFLACAKLLIDGGYTAPERLAIEGGSNGGLLVGAALTQRPELFRAAVAHVGLYDMLHFERYPNGVFNVTEYGSISDPAQFQALYAYSPYHRVRDGVLYPAVLLLSGENDPRVNPADSRKLAARLQAAVAKVPGARPVLLRTRSSGHAAGRLSDQIDQATDVFTFLFQQLGLSYPR